MLNYKCGMLNEMRNYKHLRVWKTLYEQPYAPNAVVLADERMSDASGRRYMSSRMHRTQWCLRMRG